MRTFNPGMAGLRVQLALARWGLINGVTCLLFLAGAMAWCWWLPYARAQLKMQIGTQQQAISQARLALHPVAGTAPIIALPVAEQHLADFYDALGEQRYSEQQIKTLFALAAKTGIRLTQAEYKSALDKNGRYRTYQIVLPVKGSYAQIRQFCEMTLLAIPFASLDEVSFKRDAIASAMLDAHVRFTLYLNDEAGAMNSHTTESVTP